MKFNKKKAISLIFVLLGISMVIFMAVVVKYHNPEKTIFLPCMIYKLTGIKCAGCGMTRAVYYFLNGDIKKAMWYNLLLIPTGIVATYTGYRYVMYLIKDKEIINKTLEILIYILFALIIIFMIARNITNLFY